MKYLERPKVTTREKDKKKDRKKEEKSSAAGAREKEENQYVERKNVLGVPASFYLR